MTDSVALRRDLVVVRDEDKLALLSGTSTHHVSGTVLDAVLRIIADRGRVRVEDMAEALVASLQIDPAEGLALVERLVGVVLDRVEEDSDPSAGDDVDAIAVIGIGELARRISVALEQDGRHVVRLAAGMFASQLDPAFREQIVVGRIHEQDEDAWDVDRLRSDLTGARAAVCALDEIYVRAQLDVAAACSEAQVPCLFVSPAVAAIDVGPTSIGSSTAGPGARFDESNDLTQHRFVPKARNIDIERALPRVIDEIGLLASDQLRPGLVNKLCCYRDSTHGGAEEILLEGAGLDPGDVATESTDVLFAAVDTQWPVVTAPRWSKPVSAYRSIGVLGGGTAGYLTALTLRAMRPEIDVTVIESSALGVIGVGEATTSELPAFLHRVLGLDIGELFEQVQPTWKLGIRFQWSAPDHHFNYAFDFGRPLESWLYDQSLEQVTLMSALMEAGKGLALHDGSRTRSLLNTFPFAYHLDNERFVAYLKARALEAGVQMLDRVVEDVELDAHGAVSALCTTNRERLSFDFYVDCSGFRSELLERRLGSRFESYESSLPTDRAIVADIPREGAINPYTTAEFMDHGWCWNIPMPDVNHRGYVYSSAFASEDQAVAEMRRKNPAMGDYWTVDFRSGRHQEFVIGNMAAIGNAYGFVEPLESTAMVATVWQAILLAQHLPELVGEVRKAEAMNREVAGMWDYLRGFLAVHYRFNRGYDTPFWDWCRHEVDLAGAAPIVDLWREGAPLVYQSFGRSVDRHHGGVVFSNFGFDMMMFGLGEQPTAARPPREPEPSYRSRMAATGELAARCLPADETLRMLTTERPDLLRAAVDDPKGWMRHFSQFIATGGWTPQGGIYN